MMTITTMPECFSFQTKLDSSQNPRGFFYVLDDDYDDDDAADDDGDGQLSSAQPIALDDYYDDDDGADDDGDGFPGQIGFQPKPPWSFLMLWMMIMMTMMLPMMMVMASSAQPSPLLWMITMMTMMVPMMMVMLTKQGKFGGDGGGGRRLPATYIRSLEKAGADLRFCFPLVLPIYFIIILHHHC